MLPYKYLFTGKYLMTIICVCMCLGVCLSVSVCVQNIDFLMYKLIKDFKGPEVKIVSSLYLKKETKFYKAVQNRKCLENVLYATIKISKRPLKELKNRLLKRSFSDI